MKWSEKDKTKRITAINITTKMSNDLQVILDFLGTETMSVGIRFALHKTAEAIRNNPFVIDISEEDRNYR